MLNILSKGLAPQPQQTRLLCTRWLMGRECKAHACCLERGLCFICCQWHMCRSMVRTAESLKRTAYHESGHALVAFHTEGAHPIHKATIVPRGHALGMVQQVCACRHMQIICRHVPLRDMSCTTECSVSACQPAARAQSTGRPQRNQWLQGTSQAACPAIDPAPIGAITDAAAPALMATLPQMSISSMKRTQGDD